MMNHFSVILVAGLDKLRMHTWRTRNHKFYKLSCLIIFWQVCSRTHIFSFLSNFKDTLKAVCSYHVTYAFQSESTLHSSCLDVKEFLARNRCDIWSLSDYNGIRIHNHLVRKQTLNYLAKLGSWLNAKWLSLCSRTKWLWAQIPLHTLKYSIHYTLM